jgi:hypothetical protein
MNASVQPTARRPSPATGYSGKSQNEHIMSALSGHRATQRLSALCGEFNESTQHLLILADEEVCDSAAWQPRSA